MSSPATPITGVASWFGPERHGPSPDAMGAHGFGAILEQSGPDATNRLLAMLQEIEANHGRLATEPHGGGSGAPKVGEHRVDTPVDGLVGRELELAEDGPDVRLDRLKSDVQQLADCAVRMALRHETQDLALP